MFVEIAFKDINTDKEYSVACETGDICLYYTDECVKIGIRSGHFQGSFNISRENYRGIVGHIINFQSALGQR